MVLLIRPPKTAALPPKDIRLYNQLQVDYPGIIQPTVLASYPTERTEGFMAAVKEKGTPRDQDKLIRQLSLVTYLMARQGRPVSAETIRQSVEGYDDGTRSQEAVARRFFADRRAAAAGHRDRAAPMKMVRRRLLLPPDFFLPPVPFSPEEPAALHTCLHLLDGQFAHSNLRLVLRAWRSARNTLEIRRPAAWLGTCPPRASIPSREAAGPHRRAIASARPSGSNTILQQRFRG
jgi:hypothetical protein